MRVENHLVCGAGMAPGAFEACQSRCKGFRRATEAFKGLLTAEFKAVSGWVKDPKTAGVNTPQEACA